MFNDTPAQNKTAIMCQTNGKLKVNIYRAVQYKHIIVMMI